MAWLIHTWSVSKKVRYRLRDIKEEDKDLYWSQCMMEPLSSSGPIICCCFFGSPYFENFRRVWTTRRCTSGRFPRVSARLTIILSVNTNKIHTPIPDNLRLWKRFQSLVLSRYRWKHGKKTGSQTGPISHLHIIKFYRQLEFWILSSIDRIGNHEAIQKTIFHWASTPGLGVQ